MVRSRGLRADELFKKELFKIKLERANRGMGWDSDRRITKAITRTSLWPSLRDIIINSPLEDDRSRVRKRTKIKARPKK
jgi:hypothetical protein